MKTDTELRLPVWQPGAFLNEGLSFASGAADADLVMVKLRQAKPYLKEFYGVSQETECYAESDLLVAIRYLESYAISLYRPLIICMGMGTSMGDHEGHSVLADYLSSIALRRSRCVICCAGNEGNAAHHYEGGSRAGQTESVEIRVDEREDGFTMEALGKDSEPACHYHPHAGRGGDTAGGFPGAGCTGVFICLRKHKNTGGTHSGGAALR